MRSARSAVVPVGLRWRLAGWVALVTVLCTGIAFAAVYGGTGTQLRHQIDHEMSGDASELVDNLQAAGVRTPAQLSLAATRYVSNQPFSASSTLLFALIAGARPASNRPELFASAAVPDNGETTVEQAQENRLSTHLLSAAAGYSTQTQADVGNLRLLKRVVHLRGGLSATIGVGEPLAAVAHAQQGVARTFILAGLLALAGALAGAYLIGSRISRPLRRMAGVAARVDAGDLHPRIERVGGQGDEIKVLADAFNHMLDRLTDAFAAQRAFVADASHELRTPLTVIRGQLEVLARQSAPSGEEVRRVQTLVQAEIARITRLIDDLLLLASAEQTQFLRIESIDLPAFVCELWDAMSLLASRRFELGPVPAGTLRADPDRLAQALRNLVANAIEHTEPDRGIVRLRVECDRADSPNRTRLARVRFIVEDDGPGIAPEQRERVFRRFHRTDAARDRASGGTGLGLAIVRAIADAHAGAARAGRSAEGGARVELELPGFTRAREDASPALAPVPAQPASGTR
jgi:two-component system, OmpR family, sensor kinase